MDKWVCHQCGLYQKLKRSDLKSGRKVYFYKDKNCERNIVAKVKQLTKGVILTRRKEFFDILVDGRIFKIKDVDVFPENMPSALVYNMFGVCKC